MISNRSKRNHATMAAHWKWLPLLLPLLLMACDQKSPLPSYSYEPEVNVFALLMLNNQQKTVRVERTYKATDYLPDQRGIDDATIFISSDSQKVSFVHRGNGLYQDVGSELLLRAGRTYHLEVTLADGNKIIGECTQPDRPKIVAPKNGATVDAYRLLNIEWQRTDFAYRYLVFADNGDRSFSVSERTDSTAITLYTFLFADPEMYLLRVAAADPNYYAYLLGSSDDEPASTLDGGLGVFGAVAYDEISVIAR